MFYYIYSTNSTTVQCIPVDAFVLLTFHAISEAAITTDPPTRTTTAATTAPMIATVTCVGGGNVDDGYTVMTSGTVQSKHRSLQW